MKPGITARNSTGFATRRCSLLSYGFLWRGEDCFRPKIIGENCCDEASMPWAKLITNIKEKVYKEDHL